MDAADQDVQAYLHLPAAHRTESHSPNPIERCHGEITRRTDMVGILPSAAAANESAVVRRVGAILREPSGASATRRARCMTREAVSIVHDTTSVRLRAVPV